MKKIKIIRLTLSFLMGICATTFATEPSPWVFNAPAAEGYSIKLDSINPVPGTPLVAGDDVSIDISGKYEMTIANHGAIIVVPQDDKNRSLTPGEKQVRQEISGPTGDFNLTQTLIVPKNAKQVIIFIPIVPEGINSTTGEITVIYPITKKKK